MDKRKLYQYLEDRAQDFYDLSDEIWGLAELSMQEYGSTAAYLAALEREGFRVENHLAGLPTAFSGSYGSGRPVIGILGEFDALSSLSQKAGETTHCPLTEGGCGHGCGHNLLGAAALAAAVALKRSIEAGELHGTVVFYGCPGEEGCSGKAFMARAGLFRELDAALSWHPGDTNEVTTGSNSASIQYVYTFHGVAAHAAHSPHMGRSALDAAELMNVGVQFLREHMPRTDFLHYSILDAGGISPNVVQPTARVLYMVRSDCVRNAKKLLARVHKIAQGAAMMTETEVTWRQLDGTSSIVSNAVLERLLDENLRAAPLPTYTAEELAFAKALAATYEPDGLPGQMTAFDETVREQVEALTEQGTLALNNFVMPYVHAGQMAPGSSDVGDVSWLTPTAQFTAVTWTSGAPGHSWQNVSIGKSSIAHKGLILAAKVLAGTAADLMERPDVLAAARAEFEKKTREGYDCPLEPDTEPDPAQ